MIDSLNLGKYIYSALTGDENISCKIYPLVADNDAKIPFIVYRRSNLSSNNTKDGLIEDDVTIEIIVVSDKYSESLSIATAIRKTLERQSVVYDNLLIENGVLTFATEEFSNNNFIQRLQFNFKINKNY